MLELGRLLPAGQGNRPLRHDRPGIQLRGHHHQRHATDAIAGEDRGRNRVRAAMPGQERRVDIQRRAVAQLQQVVRDELPVRGKQEPVRRVGPEQGTPLVRAETPRGGDPDPMSTPPRGDRRGARLQPSAGGTVRSADDEQVVREPREALKQGNGERAGAQECDAAEAMHRERPARCPRPALLPRRWSALPRARAPRASRGSRCRARR
jgi:hypothetical protein